MEVFSGLARGSYLVCIGWTALIVSNDVARVGQAFIVAMLTNILAGPLVGVIADRYNRKHVAIVAHLLISLPLLVLGLVLAGGLNLSLIWFFLVVILVSTFRMLYHFAHDGLIHANVNKADLVHMVARFRGVHLFATSAGTVAAGLIIERFSPAAGFVFSASMPVFLIIPVAFVAGVRTKESVAGFAGFAADFVGALEIFRTGLTQIAHFWSYHGSYAQESSQSL